MRAIKPVSLSNKDNREPIDNSLCIYNLHETDGEHVMEPASDALNEIFVYRPEFNFADTGITSNLNYFKLVI